MGSVEMAVGSITGTVRDAGGRGIRNVLVTISGGGLPQPITVQTGQFGSYAFTGILTGQTYTVTAVAKRFTFTPPSQMIVLSGDVTNANFVADPGFGVRPSDGLMANPK